MQPFKLVEVVMLRIVWLSPPVEKHVFYFVDTFRFPMPLPGVRVSSLYRLFIFAVGMSWRKEVVVLLQCWTPGCRKPRLT